MLGDARGQLGELGLGLPQRFLRRIEPLARAAFLIARFGFQFCEGFDLAGQLREDLPRLADQRFLARRVVA